MQFRQRHLVCSGAAGIAECSFRISSGGKLQPVHKRLVYSDKLFSTSLELERYAQACVDKIQSKCFYQALADTSTD
jgi:hypothetical protein